MADLLAAKEMAGELRIHYRTLVKKARTGEIPCYRSGKILRFDPDEVRRKLKGA